MKLSSATIGVAVSLVALVSLAVPACGVGANVSGRLGADRTGDISNPPAERIDPRDSLLQACTQPTQSAAASPPALPFVRSPYLQQMTDASVQLMWVGTADPAPSVSVTTPDGTAVAAAAPVSDTGIPLPASADAQWRLPISGLQPSSTYCYEIRAGDAAAIRTGFRTAPAPGTGAPVRFIAFGDSGSGSADQEALLAQMATVPFDFMIHTGDIAYETGTRAELQHNFFDIYAGLLRDFPVFPISGNHDYETDDAAPFREAFDLPENGSPDGTERWYSYDWGDVHFVALDTERTGPVQAAWLDRDLAANQLPWTIVFGHKPPFSSGEHGNDAAFQQNFVPIIEKHHVPLVLNGHDHDYERTIPLNGVTYVVTGGGGVGVRNLGASSFTAFDDSVIHFVYVTVTGNQLALHAIDGLGQEFDSLVLRR